MPDQATPVWGRVSSVCAKDGPLSAGVASHDGGADRTHRTHGTRLQDRESLMNAACRNPHSASDGIARAQRTTRCHVSASESLDNMRGGASGCASVACMVRIGYGSVSFPSGKLLLHWAGSQSASSIVHQLADSEKQGCLLAACCLCQR